MLAGVLLGLSFATGALRVRQVPHGFRLSAHDTRDVRRLAVTLTTRERPDIAIFDARGQRLLR